MTDVSWKDIVIDFDLTIMEAMQKMNRTGRQTLLICNADLILLGSVSDGDIRKGLVRGLSLQSSVKDVAHTTPVSVGLRTTAKEINRIFNEGNFRLLPIVDEKMRVIGCHFIDDMLAKQGPSVPMLIMAGGFGRRLGDFTKHVPKPLLVYQGKPMIRHIIDAGVSEGITDFYVSIHYRGNQVMDYLRSLDNLGARFHFIEETKPLGTAGSIGLMPVIDGPILVSNCDIISKIEYQKLLIHHQSNDAHGTMVVRKNEMVNPFGVVITDGMSILGFEEKPVWRTSINAGIYVIDEAAKKLVAPNEAIDMPQLFERMKDNGLKTIIYQLTDDWLDIGQVEHFSKGLST